METKLKSAHNDEASLNDIVNYLKTIYKFLITKWIIILSIGLIGAIIGLFIAYSKVPLYVSNTTFVLDNDGGGGSSLSQYSELASVAGIDLGAKSGNLFQGDNIIELYKSRKMISKALFSSTAESDHKLLVDKFIEINRWRDNWNKNHVLNNLRFTKSDSSDKKVGTDLRLKDSVISQIVSNINNDYLTVEKFDKKSSIIKVSVKSPNESFSKNFNDALVRIVNDYYIQTKTKKSIRNINILKQQSDSVRRVLNGAIVQVAVTNDATPNLNITRQVLKTPIQKSQANADANKAILTEMVKNLETSKMLLLQETPLIQIIDNPVYPLMKIKSSKLFNILTGFFVGILAAIGYMIVKRLFNLN